MVLNFHGAGSEPNISNFSHQNGSINGNANDNDQLGSNLLSSMGGGSEDYLTLNDFNVLNIDWNANDDTSDMFNI